MLFLSKPTFVLHELFSSLLIHLVVTVIVKESRKIVRKDKASDIHLFELTALTYMSRQKFLTVEEALPALEDSAFGEDKLDVVRAPPVVTVISAKERLKFIST